MTRITICITAEEINTSKCGLHFEKNLSNGMVINFTPDAVKELLKDMTKFELEALKESLYDNGRGVSTNIKQGAI